MTTKRIKRHMKTIFSVCFSVKHQLAPFQTFTTILALFVTETFPQQQSGELPGAWW